MDSYIGPNRVYTYSDFTGSVRRTAIGVGNYEQDYDAGCADPLWSDLEWDAETPTGSRVIFTARTAAAVVDLDAAAPVEVVVTPTDESPMDIDAALTAAGLTSEQYLRLTVTLDSGGVTSPTLRSYSVSWHCS
jgi:hypothetical protein